MTCDFAGVFEGGLGIILAVRLRGGSVLGTVGGCVGGSHRLRTASSGRVASDTPTYRYQSEVEQPEAAASQRLRGGGFRGVRLRGRGFNGSSFIRPTLKGCFFTVLLRTFAPSIDPLDERDMLLPVSDFPPPLVLPLLAGLTTVTDWIKAWQYGHLVVLAGKSSCRNAAKHDVLVQSFMILFAIAIASPGKFTSRRYGTDSSRETLITDVLRWKLHKLAKWIRR